MVKEVYYIMESSDYDSMMMYATTSSKGPADVDESIHRTRSMNPVVLETAGTQYDVSPTYDDDGRWPTFMMMMIQEVGDAASAQVTHVSDSERGGGEKAPKGLSIIRRHGSCIRWLLSSYH